ncbi:MAG: glycosyltransferase, partial [Sphingobacteriales bacterium]|nr:glycosyltransferase [Sphingobacteriales bacterium]
KWLVQHVFNESGIPFIIAGKEPSQQLQSCIKKHANISLIANPSDEEMQQLITDAQINILPSFNTTGVKLKLLNALYNGRHCLVNQAGVAGSGLEALCHIAETANGFKESIQQLYTQPFTEDISTQREALLPQLYNNDRNAQQLITWIL